jgi:hypothetical protein
LATTVRFVVEREKCIFSERFRKGFPTARNYIFLLNLAYVKLSTMKSESN